MIEGYIKFNCQWTKEEISIQDELFQELEKERSRLYKLGLIGVYPDGIGFGNISVRLGESSGFIITGSATGQFSSLSPSHYAKVTDYNFEKNFIACTGLTKASAESLTHAVIYEARSEAGAVVHVHNLKLWKKLINKFPTTSKNIEYGTPEMAQAVKMLAEKSNSHFEKIIIMGGHQEGILTYGSNLREATDQIINLYNH
jgi:ribulose-5-phosphate 4-epimerase/fuculose-1-phosphate aldolase